MWLLMIWKVCVSFTTVATPWYTSMCIYDYHCVRVLTIYVYPKLRGQMANWDPWSTERHNHTTRTSASVRPSITSKNGCEFLVSSYLGSVALNTNAHQHMWTCLSDPHPYIWPCPSSCRLSTLSRSSQELPMDLLADIIPPTHSQSKVLNKLLLTCSTGSTNTWSEDMPCLYTIVSNE